MKAKEAVPPPLVAAGETATADGGTSSSTTTARTRPYPRMQGKGNLSSVRDASCRRTSPPGRSEEKTGHRAGNPRLHSSQRHDGIPDKGPCRHSPANLRQGRARPARRPARLRGTQGKGHWGKARKASQKAMPASTKRRRSTGSRPRPPARNPGTSSGIGRGTFGKGRRPVPPREEAAGHTRPRLCGCPFSHGMEARQRATPKPSCATRP